MPSTTAGLKNPVRRGEEKKNRIEKVRKRKASAPPAKKKKKR